MMRRLRRRYHGPATKVAWQTTATEDASLDYSPRRHGGTERADKGSTSLVCRQARRPAVRQNLRVSVVQWVFMTNAG